MRSAVLIFILVILNGLIPGESRGQLFSNAGTRNTTKKTTPADTVKPIKRTPVDVRGRALDTDGDGIPDYKDKELLTHQSCFPVDSTGVGICPEPNCCKIGHPIIDPVPSCNIDPVQIVFTLKNKTLTIEHKKQLSVLAQQLKANPYCKVTTGTSTSAKKADMNLGWERVNSIIRFLVEQEGIAEERIVFGYDVGELNIVELIVRDERNIPPVPIGRPGRRD